MKNYIYDWMIKERGCVEVTESEYTIYQKDMSEYINDLSKVLVKANCGWDGLKYMVMKNSFETNEYMVLYVDGHGERYIPINANSKGCNLQVLGENIW